MKRYINKSVIMGFAVGVVLTVIVMMVSGWMSESPIGRYLPSSTSYNLIIDTKYGDIYKYEKKPGKDDDDFISHRVYLHAYNEDHRYPSLPK